MESTEARSDFISLYLELCPEAIVAYSMEMLALLSNSGGGKKKPNQPKPTKQENQQPTNKHNPPNKQNPKQNKNPKLTKKPNSIT